MSQLFSPFTLRKLTFKNRIFVSPMCQYSSIHGMPNDWHLVHLGARAVGGAGLVMTEAASVTADGRISPEDVGIWNDAQGDAWKPTAAFIRANGSVPAIQLAHAGRKASSYAPWRGSGLVGADKGGWEVMGPSGNAFSEKLATPHAMSREDIRNVIDAFANAAKRALDAGFQVVEVHAAHGYLAHQFLSPFSNLRQDEYGGSLENRMRFVLEVSAVVREIWPQDLPVFVRISATDWKDGGWDLAQSITLCQKLKKLGVDLIDVSSGGSVPDAVITAYPGFQVPFARAIRESAEIATGAVGLITAPAQAEEIIASGNADCVFLARALLREPHWPLNAAAELGVAMEWPNQYKRAIVNAMGKT
jgi:2,4-dienoyl-CoA reductase-like NADH-dependent reductase (Old Yellow Enzyme family)